MHSRSELFSKIDAIPYVHGDTHTAAALQYVIRNVRWRKRAPKIIIFITDGKPQDVKFVPDRAKVLRRRANMTIFAIGVGTASEAELEDIASTPYDQRVFFMSEGQFNP